MENSDFLSSLSPFIHRHLVPLSLGVVGILLIVISLWSLVAGPKTPESDVVFEAGAESGNSTQQSFGSAQDKSVLSSQDSAASSTEQTANSLQVDVSGAVASPGVITLASNSRVQDAIKAAGGLSPQANNEWIAKNLNLAARLSDAAKIYIPFVGEQGVIGGDTGVTGDKGDKGGLININTASQAQLEGLSGVGPVTAQKIISNRPYSSIDDLLTKKAVGQSVFEKIKEQVTTN